MTHRQALVWSQFDRTLSTLDLSELGPRPGGPTKVVAYPKTPTPAAKTTVLPMTRGKRLSPKARRGRELFHATQDRRITADGRACASCHPDGRDDGLTWPTPHGPRQTPMLAGRLAPATAPYGWQGAAKTVAAHVTETFARLGGSGLPEEELDALVAYLAEMATPTQQPHSNEALVARGRALFEHAAVGCAACHTDGGGSDGQNHRFNDGPALDTPSLRFVGGTGPYWHDGRYATLGALLRDTQGTMGSWARELSPEEVSALEAYVNTL
ncbi:MAG: c-type cytochrome [Myxococcota bacterium]